ncbi:PPE family protein [Amycolatopsis tolypomycina]|uniref:PPE family protein n=1 Tax=Amycolatopsis tolypomycina TaxID=208445 RepID=A0A1H4IWX6_9PSEU|nr:PPE domain-containing protein [Amycolatopsis tolypomycina]SEB38116.1 PPE family protein [Amycolatopsis tolypomycina]
MEFSELAAGIQNHRFDGWTNTAIADQITRMVNGDGTGSIGTAVEALKAVATALARTDETLRAQLLELGVEWQSQAGGAASQVFTEQAGFSQDATTKVAHAAEMVFEQGEAFNRTKYKLPDAETVRKGAGGLTLTDGLLMSLIGFETDHARQVEAANDAKAQAQQALNEYAQQSGTNLLSTQALSDPESLKLAAPGITPGVLDVAGAAVEVTPDGGVKPASDKVRSVRVEPPVVQPVSHTVHADPPTPAYGVAAAQPSRPAPQQPSRQTGSVGAAPAAQHTTPSSTTPAGAKPPAHTPGPGWVQNPGRGTSGEPAGRFTPGPAGGGHGDPFVPPGAPGGLPPGSAPATAPIKSLGGSGGGGAPGGSTGIDSSAGRGADGLLGKGRTVGAMPQAPLQPGQYTGERAFPVKPGATPGDIGAGAAAIGAGVAGGALSGDKERQRREKSQPKGPVRPLPVGQLPEEEAVALRKSEQISPKQRPGEAKFLSEAAPQEEDAEHVRRYGVDDQDLFADQRMVSPDVLGDHGRDGR